MDHWHLHRLTRGSFGPAEDLAPPRRHPRDRSRTIGPSSRANRCTARPEADAACRPTSPVPARLRDAVAPTARPIRTTLEVHGDANAGETGVRAHGSSREPLQPDGPGEWRSL
ncbi:hypothetical protein KM043_006913 [Ampulex compressa]|nr:hypothetical protein KM043_006913 [Ampulex compressa]